MFWRESYEIFLGELEQFDCRSQAPAVFGVRRMLEVLLQMHECARGLDQSLEKIIVGSVVVEPKLLQNIVRLIVALFVPAMEIGPIIRIFRHLAGARSDIVALELAHKLRNPLAFVHGALNFITPQMMGKPTFPEGLDFLRDRSDE